VRDLALHHLSFKARSAINAALDHAHANRRPYIELSDIEHGIERVRRDDGSSPRGAASGTDADGPEGGVG
jgi:hypothetical protein